MIDGTLPMRRWREPERGGGQRRGAFARPALALLAALACLGGFTAAARATVPGTPRIPQNPSLVFSENFEHQVAAAPKLLSAYVGVDGTEYTADDVYLRDCNGAVLAFESADADRAASGCPSYPPYRGYDFVRQMAYALGRLQGDDVDAARANHAVTAFTQSQPPGAGKVQFATRENTPIVFPQKHDRFLTFSLDAAELCAPPGAATEHNLAEFQFYLVDQAGQATPAYTSPIATCDDAGAKTIAAPPIGDVTTSTEYQVGKFASNRALLFSGDTLGIRMTNGQGASEGNDAAFDDIRVVDATPRLDKSFSPAVLNRGETTHLTFTVTNTTDLAAKEGWSFTDVLAAGLHVVPGGEIENECGGSVTIESVGGHDVIAVHGSLAAGQHYCTVTVPVTSAVTGTYTDGPGDVEVSGVNPPGEAVVEFGDADLSITKRASESVVDVGSEVTYTLTVTNHGPLSAEGVTVTDPLTGLEVVSASPGCAHVEGGVRCALASLPPQPDPGSTHTFTIVARLPDSHPDGIANTATVHSETPDPFPGNNQDTVITHGRRKADLAIAKLTSEKSVGPLDQLTYTLVVTNHGPHKAAGVIVTDPLSPDLRVVSVEPSQGRCGTGAGVVCRLGELANGASAQIMVTVIVTRYEVGTVRNTARVDSDEIDPNPGDNVAHAKVRVRPPRPEDPADLVVTKHAGRVTATQGEHLAYLLTVKDRGLDAATGVRLIDTASLAGRVVSVEPSQGSCEVGEWLTCELGRIEAGAKVTVKVVVEPTHAGASRDTVGVTAAQLDPKPADNLSGVTVRIGSKPALGVGCHKAGARLVLPPTKVTAAAGIRQVTVSIGGRLVRRFRFRAPLPTEKVIRGARIQTAGLSPGLHTITILVKGADGDVTHRALRFTICPRPRFTG